MEFEGFLATSNAGSAGVSGEVTIKSGTSSSGVTGGLKLSTGNAKSGRAGDISLLVGSGTTGVSSVAIGGGAITIAGGESDGSNAADVRSLVLSSGYSALTSSADVTLQSANASFFKVEVYQKKACARLFADL